VDRLLAIVLETEEKAQAAMRALRHLDRKGDITLNASGSISKDANGHVSALRSADASAMGDIGAGVAVVRPGSGRGHPAGPAPTMVAPGSSDDMHGFWLAGVGLHFVEEASKFLKPGQVAVVADVKETWTIPLDMAMAAVGGTVLRRARLDVVQAEFDQDITSIRQEIRRLEVVYERALGGMSSRSQDRIDATASPTSKSAMRITLKLTKLERETAIHVRAIEVQAAKAQEKASLRRTTRLARLRKRYEKRVARLSQAEESLNKNRPRASNARQASG
jgi:uncharacterized membrane protein